MAKVKLLRSGAVPPSKMTPGAAGYDLIWCPDPDARPANRCCGCRSGGAGVVDAGEGAPAAAAFDPAPAIGPGMTVRTFATGIAVELPPGHWWLLKERYSLGRLGILVLGGVVDEDYREEVEVTMLGSEAAWTRANVQPGQRIAQAVLMRVHEDEIVQVDSLSRTDRGPGAGGSTGR